MEKEIILKSKKFPNLILQIFDDSSFGMLGEDEKGGIDEEEFFTDNVFYAFEVLKLLKEAEKRGCFDKIKKEERIEDYNENKREVILI